MVLLYCIVIVLHYSNDDAHIGGANWLWPTPIKPTQHANRRDDGCNKLHPKCIFVIKRQILNIKKLSSLQDLQTFGDTAMIPGKKKQSLVKHF